MNTSSNKIRITDYGWLNTARDTLGISTDAHNFHTKTEEDTSPTLISRSRSKYSKREVVSIEGEKTPNEQYVGDNKKTRNLHYI